MSGPTSGPTEYELLFKIRDLIAHSVDLQKQQLAEIRALRRELTTERVTETLPMALKLLKPEPIQPLLKKEVEGTYIVEED